MNPETPELWPSVADLKIEVPLPEGVESVQLSRADLPVLCPALGVWYRDLAVGYEADLLTPSFYEREVALLGEDNRLAARRLYALLLKSGREPIGIHILEYGPYSNLIGRMSVVSPLRRGQGLGAYLMRAKLKMGKAIGASLLYGVAELDNHAQCRHLKHEGYLLCGVIPDSEIRRVKDQVCYVPEGIYARPLVAPSCLSFPDPAKLSTQVRSLFSLLRLPGTPAALLQPDGLDTLSAVSALAPHAMEPAPPGHPRPTTWPDVERFSAHIPMPDDVRVRATSRQEMLAILRRWSPEPAELRCIEADVSPFDESPERREWPPLGLLLERRAAPLMLCCISYDSHGDTVQIERVVGALGIRTSVVATQLLSLVVRMGQAVGARVISAWAPLHCLDVQHMFERGGFSLWGLIPAADSLLEEDGRLARGFRAVYGISLVPQEQTHKPDASSLPPDRAAILRLLPS